MPRFTASLSRRFALLARTLLATVAGLTVACLSATAQQGAPNTAVGSSSPVQTSTITITANGVLSAINVLSQGAAGMDFNLSSGGTCAIGTNYLVGQTCTVRWVFTPLHASYRPGGITLVTGTSTPSVIGGFYISSLGQGPQITFPNTLAGKVLAGGLSYPLGVAVDGSGNFFVADSHNSVVREFFAAGGYTTSRTIGSGFASPAGVALDGKGNLFVADYTNNVVQELLLVGDYTTIFTLGSGTGFSNPFGLVVTGSGDVFVADQGNNAVKQITASGGYTTVASRGTGFNAPSGIAMDTSGNIYVADTNNGAIKEILATGYYQTTNTLYSGLPAPVSVAVDVNHNLFVADNNAGVKEIFAATGYATISSLGSGLASPSGLILDGTGNLFVTDNTSVVELQFGTPPSVLFPAPTAAGSTDTTDGTKFITLVNSGNASLSIASIAPSNSNFTFTGASSSAPFANTAACGTTLAQGAFCSIGATFTPQIGGGTPTANGLVTDNALNNGSAVQSIALSGIEPQTITFPQPSTPATAGTTATLTATATSSLGVTYSITSGPATISGSTVNYTGGGTVVIAANQAGNANYTAATVVSRSVTVLAAQTITFPQPAPGNPNTSATLTATASSGLAVTYSITSGPATLSGSTITYIAVGTVVIAANQAGNAGYAAAPAVTVSVTVALLPPTITFGTIAAHTYGDAPFAVSATSSSGQTPTLVVTSGPATLSGSTLTITGGGTVVLTASTPSNASYGAGSQTANIVVAKATPVLIAQTPAPIIFGTTTSSPFTASITYGSGTTPTGAITYAINGQTGNAVNCTGMLVHCSIYYGDISLSPAGNYTFTVTIAADSNYVAVTSAAVTLVISQQTPALSSSAATFTYGSGSLSSQLTYSGNNVPGGTVGFSIDGGTSSAATCTGSGSTGPLTCTYGFSNGAPNAGTHTVATSYTGDGNYVAVNAANVALTINKQTPTVTLPATSIVYGAATETVAMLTYSGSGLPPTGGVLITLSNGSSATAVCTGSSSPLTCPITTAFATLAPGSYTQVAKYVGDGNYATVTTTSTAFTIAKQTPVVVVTAPAGVYGQPYTVTGTVAYAGNVAPTGLVTFQFGDAVSRQATCTGSTSPFTCTYTLPAATSASFFAIGTGNYVHESVASDTNYAAVNSANTGFTVVAGTLTVSVNSPTINSGSSAVLTATIPYGGTAPPTGNLGFSVDGGAGYVGSCSATGSPIVCTFTTFGTPLTVGTHTSKVTLPASTYYNAAVGTGTITVVLQSQTITFPTTSAQTYSAGLTTTLSATSTSGLPITYTVLSGPATVSGSTLTYTGPGVVMVQAAQAGNSAYSAATPVTNSITVFASQTITFPQPPAGVYGASTVLNATASSGLPITYAIAQGPATLSGSTLTYTGVTSPGVPVIVTANQAGNATYVAAPVKTVSIFVSAATQTITFTAPVTPVVYGTSPITLVASSTSGYVVRFTVLSGPGSVSGSLLTLTGAGTIVVAANQDGDANYGAASQVMQTLVVTQASQTITLATPAPVSYVAGGTYTLAPVGGASGNAVTCAITSGPATISGLVVSYTAAGTIAITCNQAGNSQYAAAAAKSISLVVNKGTVVITPPTLPATVVFGAAGPLNVAATATAGLPVMVSVVGPGSLNSSVLSVTGTGTIEIDYVVAATTDYVGAMQSVFITSTPPAPMTTDLTSTPIGTTVPITYTMVFTQSFTAGTISILSQGAPGTPGVIAGTGTCSSGSSYAAGASCTVNINFTPTGPGVITETVFLYDSLGNLQAAIPVTIVRYH